MAESRSEETNVGETKAAGNDTETVQNSSSLHSLTEKLQGLDIMIESQTKLKEMQENGTDWLQNVTLKKASGKKSEKDHGKESVSAEMSKFVCELQRTDIKETSPEKDKKADSPGKKKQKIGSISSEMQAEFLASYQENLVCNIGSDDTVMRETQSVDMKEIEGARIKQKYSSEAGCVEDRKGEMKDNSAGSVEKKSPKKKKNKKKGPSPEKGNTM
ncbi:hypothetical protein DPMN_037556 [Dreissena polymorpha]|uniref:Uncharacterized protein n=1 Tax=Dreissena polymorpha TaxID=45954 RepID=A0A9D4MER5_DREPO|nr:hypothetical protein DPMN_037556 [Dreissena polymorpha]